MYQFQTELDKRDDIFCSKSISVWPQQKTGTATSEQVLPLCFRIHAMHLGIS